MSWTIDIPYRSRDDELADVAPAAARSGPGGSRRLRNCSSRRPYRHKTAGDLFIASQGSPPPNAAVCSISMRERAGLESTADIEARRAFEAANRALTSEA